MAANDGDHPVTDSMIPGLTYPTGTNAQGSTGGQPHAPGDGGSVGTAALSPVFESVQGGVPHVDVGTLGVQGAGSVMTDGISGITQQTSTGNLDGSGHVITPDHPNAMRQ